MDYKEENNKIPFGAKDSELVEATYFIPEGMEAVIEGDKVIIRRKESEDEKIRKALIGELNTYFDKDTKIDGFSIERIIAWLEKQGKQKFEMKSAAESLGVDSDTYNKIVDECIWGEQKPADEIEEAMQEVIKKACEWLENHNDYICGGTNGVSWYNMQQLVNDFKKYMEEGICG